MSHPTALPLSATQATRSVLVVGALGLGAKEQLLLRSLVRLLHGSAGLELRFADTPDECQVVFLPDDAAVHVLPPQLGVQVVADVSKEPHPGLRVQLPLRASNVGAVLQTAAQFLGRQRAAAVATRDGLAHLFDALTRLLMARERRATVFPFVDGPLLWVDFGDDRCRCDPSPHALLSTACSLGDPRRATPAETAASSGGGCLRLREFLWSLAHRLEDEGRPAPLLGGCYRLLRWPEAVALARPGIPRLSALLTSRAMGVADASRASGADLAGVGWFLAAGLALGLVELAGAVEEAPPHAPPGPAVPAAARGLIDRLRERLRLW